MKIKFLSSEGVLPEEQPALAAIQKAFPPEWVGFAGFQLMQRGAQPLDIDLLMLTPSRILIVDDEADLLDVFKMELESHGFVVRTATNGLEALEHFEKMEFDIVITDIVMPWMNGADFLKKLRAASEQRKTFVFAMSGHTLYTENQLREFGASALIAKPFDYAQVIQTIKAHAELVKAVKKVA